MKFNKDTIDDELLQELIDKCEERMASPFKEKADKKKTEMTALEVEPNDDEDSDEMEIGESEDEPKEKSDEIDPEMLEKLMESYKNRK